MTEVEAALAAELDALGRSAPHDPDLAGAVRRRARRQAAVAGSAAAVVVLAAGAGLAATRLRADPAPAAATKAPAVFDCPPLRTGVLPEWARTGFSDPAPRMPHAFTESGRMVAIVFGVPLTAPPRPDVANKVLWVPRVGENTADGFTFTARLSGSARTAAGDLGLAPGPSYVDLPAPGCWELTLRWGADTDTIRLAYAPLGVSRPSARPSAGAPPP